MSPYVVLLIGGLLKIYSCVSYVVLLIGGLLKIHSCVLYVVLLIGGLLKIHSCVSYDAVLIVTLLIGGLLRNVSVCSSAYWGVIDVSSAYHNDRSTLLFGGCSRYIRMYSSFQLHSDFVYTMILPFSPVFHKAGNHPSSRASFARCNAHEHQEGTGRPCLSEFEVIAGPPKCHHRLGLPFA